MTLSLYCCDLLQLPRYFVPFAFVGVVVAGCRSTLSVVAAEPQCTAPSRAAWSVDSSIAICLPPGFRAAGDSATHHQRWERRSLGAPSADFLVVEAEPDSEALLPAPVLGSRPGCSVDCTTVDSVAIYRDVPGVTAPHIELGLVSGGMPGLRRQPIIIAGWVTKPGGRVFIGGLAKSRAMLDTLHAMVRSVRVAERLVTVRDQSPNDR